MKQFIEQILLFFCIFVCVTGTAQTVSMPTNGSATITDFSGTLLDPGGMGNYPTVVSSVLTIAPEGACNVSISFSSFDLGSGFDNLFIFDGNSVNGDLLGTYFGFGLPNGGEPIVSNSDALTIQMVTAGFQSMPGFVAEWTSANASTDAAFIVSDENPPANTPVLFLPNTTSALSYQWDFGDGAVSTEESPQHSFLPGNYAVSLVIENCVGETGTFSLSLVTQQEPTISVSPTSFNLSLNAGQLQTQQLNITNNGAGDLVYNIGNIPLFMGGGVSMLALVNDANTEHYNKALAAVNTTFGNYTLEELTTTNPATLEEALVGKTCLFVPEQETPNVAAFANLGPVMQAFAETGGTILFTGAESGDYIFATGLLSGSNAGNSINGVTDILLPNDPLMEGISTNVYSSQINTYPCNITNDDLVRVLEYDGNDVACYRPIGDGRAIYIGHNYNFSNSPNKRLIANAVKQSVISSWIYAAPLEGTVGAGESATIDVVFDATTFCGGTYTLDLAIISNDSDTPLVTVPCTLTINGTPSLSFLQTSFDFGTIQQFDTGTQTLSLLNNGTSEVIIESIVSSDPAFNVTPSSLVLPGCGERVDLPFTFAPTDIATHNTTLTIATNIGSFNTVVGTGISVGAPITTITPNPIAVTVNAGEATTQQMVLSNSGLGPLIYEIDGAAFDGILDVLMYVNGTQNNNSVFTISSILDEVYPNNSVSTTTTTTAAALETALEGKDMFVVPTIDDASILGLFADFKPVLEAFAQEGGAVLFASGNVFLPPNFNETNAFIESGLIENTQTFSTFTNVNAVLPTHPLAEGVSSSFFPFNNAAVISGSDFDNVETVFTANGLPTVFVKEQGQGSIIYIGFNYAFGAGIDENTVLSNAFALVGANMIDWLSLSSYSGTVDFPNEQNVSVVFDATELLGGVYNTEIVITTNDPVQPFITVPVIMTVVGIPQLVSDVFELDYGNVVIGNTPELEVIISNPGTDDLIISDIASTDPAYTVSPTSAVLDPGDELAVTVTFTPTAIQSYPAALTITSNGGSAGISLSGAGQGAPSASSSPASFNVSLEEPATNTQTLNINNASSAQGALSYNLATGNILVLNFGTMQLNFDNLLEGLAAAAPNVSISTLNISNSNLDPDALEAALVGKQMLIVPPADFNSELAFSVLGSTMQEFATSGGSVVFLGMTCCLGSTGFVTGFVNSSLSGSSIVVLDDSSPLAEGVTDGYVPQPEGYLWLIQNPGYVSVMTSQNQFGDSFLGYFPEGSGRVIYFGYDFQGSDPEMLNILGNIVEFGALLPSWLNVSPTSGSINIGQNENIALTFNTVGQNTGTYVYNLVFSTNDPLNPNIIVPCTFNVIAMPNAQFAPNTTLTCTGQILFQDQSQNVPDQWTWDFGDGTTSSSQNPVHTYTTPGEYTVSLEACNDVGCDTYELGELVRFLPDGYFCDTTSMAFNQEVTSEACGSMLYDSGGPFSPPFGGEISTVHINAEGAQAVTLNVLMLDMNEFFESLTIYDGADTNAPVLATLTGITAPDEPIVSSTDQVTLVYQSQFGTGQQGFEIFWECTIIDTPPIAQFTQNITSQCEGRVQFTDNSSIFPSQWQWDFGDGSTSTEENPEHEYAQNGTYTITLVACNIAGCSNPITQNVTLNNVMAVNFTFSDDTVAVGAPVFFQDLTPGVTQRLWDYGDGVVFFNNATAIHSYNADGIYDMSLTVTNAQNCQKTKVKRIWVGNVVGTGNAPAGIGEVRILPNPSTGLFQINCSLARTEPVTITVYDVLGRAVLNQQEDRQSNTWQSSIDLSGHAKGLYWLKLSTVSHSVTEKLIVE